MTTGGDAELYAACADDLVRLATGLVGPSDATDVVAGAVARLLGSPAWRGARRKRAYLFQSVVNEARMHQRTQSRRVAREQRVAVPESVNAVPEIDALSCLDALSTRQRAVIVLTYWHDLDQAAIASLLGISRGSVARHLERAHTKLREVMADARDA